MYIYAMLITAIIETYFFLLCHYYGNGFLLFVFIINLISNFLVNQIYVKIAPVFPYNIYYLIFILEMGVVLSEYIAIELFLNKWTGKMLMLVFLANLITWGGGEIFFRFFYLK